MRLIVLIFIFLSTFLFSQSLGLQYAAYHAAGLNSDGTVYAWGRNDDGQLGNNSTVHSYTPVRVLKGAYTGSAYLGDDSDNKIIFLALGAYHSLSLAQDGTVYAWGYNTNGRLGDGTSTNSSVPIKSLMGEYDGTTYLGDDTDNKIISIAAGFFHSMALDASGKVYCWGYGASGQLGIGTISSGEPTPRNVLKGAYNGSTYLGDNSENKIIIIAGGYEHSMAIAQDGNVFSWGYNKYGQLGNNSTELSLIPVQVVKGDYSGTMYLGDNASNKIIKVVLGDSFSAALAEDGTVYTWGNNYYGQLGNNSTAESHYPIRVVKGAYNGATYLGDNASNKIIDIEVAFYHVIALAEDGSVYSWGRNNYGQLGNNSTSQSNYPIQVLKGVYDGTTYLGDDASNKIIDIASSGYHSLALAQDGSVYSWGRNNYGQLGNNSTTHSNVPVQVKGVGGTGELALPVTLTFFTAELNRGMVVLSWRTESETNNSYFKIYRNDEVIATIDGAGTTSEPHDYTYIDKNVIPGVAFTYVLSDIDHGGNERIYQDQTVTVMLNETISEQDFEILEIYPNPFNPSTTIKYRLHVNSDIQIDIYDQNGRLIQTLVDQYLVKGNYETEFDGTEFPSGVYFVTLKAGNYLENKKIVLLK